MSTPNLAWSRNWARWHSIATAWVKQRATAWPWSPVQAVQRWWCHWSLPSRALRPDNSSWSPTTLPSPMRMSASRLVWGSSDLISLIWDVFRKVYEPAGVSFWSTIILTKGCSSTTSAGIFRSCKQFRMFRACRNVGYIWLYWMVIDETFRGKTPVTLLLLILPIGKGMQMAQKGCSRTQGKNWLQYLLEANHRAG